MDGVPVFNLVRETLPAVDILGFRGIINTTTQLHPDGDGSRGGRIDEALAEMQAEGIAEADPSFDVDGWDAAAKTAALVNVLMRGAVTPRTIDAHRHPRHHAGGRAERGARAASASGSSRAPSAATGRSVARVGAGRTGRRRPARQPRRQAEPARPRHRHPRATSASSNSTAASSRPPTRCSRISCTLARSLGRTDASA